MGDKFDKQSVTEKKLLAEMVNLGLRPEPQYKISQMTVDFAFPEQKLVIEVNGPQHFTEEGKKRDRNRWFVLNKEGWEVKSFHSGKVWEHTKFIAEKIKEELEIIDGTNQPGPKYSDETETIYSKIISALSIVFVVGVITMMIISLLSL